MVRSTIHRLGTILKPIAVSERLTISNVEMRKNFCQCGGEFRSLISAIGEERLQERKHPKQCCHNHNAPVAILDIGRMDDGVEQEA